MHLQTESTKRQTMKSNLLKLKLACVSLLSLAAIAAQAQFTAGNLVVLRDGTGSAPLTSAGTAIFLDQYTTSGSFVNSLAIPSTGSSALVNSGTASSEGALNLSANGQYLVVAGYNAAAGTASIAGTTAAAAPRGVATVDAGGNYTLAATSSSFFNANNIRSAASDGAGNFWAAGANTGVAYMGNNGAATAVSASPLTNLRVVQTVGNNLFYSSSSGSSRGIYEVAGNPTSGSTTAVNVINNGANASPYDFAFNANLTLAYVADSSAFTNSTTIGGVEKWEFNGSAWVFDYSLSLGTNGATGLAVNFSGANPIIYATSADGKSLFDVTDTGATASGTLLATAAANEAIRGVDFSPQPVPEPSTLALAGMGLTTLWVFARRNRKS
jgi:hypothetical protein